MSEKTGGFRLGGPGGALRDAGFSALVAFGLFAVMIGVKTVEGGLSLYLEARPLALAAAVAVVFVGRLGVLAWRANRKPGGERAALRGVAEGARRIGRYATPLLLVFALTLPLFSGRYVLDLGVLALGRVMPGWGLNIMMRFADLLDLGNGRYVLDLGVLVLTYVMLGWGLNIVVGLAGLLDLGYVAFYAVGAYTFGILATTYDLGFWTCLPLCGAAAAFAGMLLGFPVLRLRGDYLAIVTLAFGEIIRVVILNWTTLTGGPNGLAGIPRPTLFGLTFTAGGGEGSFADFFGIEPNLTQRAIFLYYVILGLALLTNWVSLRLRRLPLGRAWEALREDEIACRSLGINVTTTKLTAFAIGAMFGGFAGAFFATRQAFISPESFTFIESAIVLAIVVLGGLGSQLGTALAALVLIGGPEIFRDLQEYRMLIFGAALVLMMIFRPRGLVSGRKPSVSLGAAKEIAPDLVAEGRG